VQLREGLARTIEYFEALLEAEGEAPRRRRAGDGDATSTPTSTSIVGERVPA
jgi:hypothetical protein